jgi:formylmethanofuran dehydrogenase subunit B
MTASDELVDHVTCLGCGCACDDIQVMVSNGRIVDTRRACELGAAWFGDGYVPWRALVGGHEVAVDAAVDATAALLAGAARPLVYLAPGLSCEAQRAIVALGDLLRAVVDSVTSATTIDSVLAAQARGRATATLGEIRNRADLVVWWGVDPSRRYPRYAERYAPAPAGLHVAAGRASRVVVAVDVGEARGPADADRRLVVAAADELTTLTALLGMCPPQDTDWSGPGSDAARALAASLVAVRYAVIVADAEPDGPRDVRAWHRADALIAVAQAFNGPTRCALSLLRAGGNRSGADAVLTWQTGYPAAVDFARGYPRYRPHDGTAGARLSRGGADAVLVVGSAAHVPAELSGLMRGVPCAVIGPRASESTLASGVAAIDTGEAGIHEAGTALRLDDVPLPLRAPIAGRISIQTIVRALSERIVAGRRNVSLPTGRPPTGRRN